MLTKHQINCRLAPFLLKDIEELDPIKNPSHDGALWADGCKWQVFDPCNDWKDIGPHIEANGISLTLSLTDEGAYAWVATSLCGKFTNTSCSPTHAASVVLLAIKELPYYSGK